MERGDLIEFSLNHGIRHDLKTEYGKNQINHTGIGIHRHAAHTFGSVQAFTGFVKPEEQIDAASDNRKQENRCARSGGHFTGGLVGLINKFYQPINAIKTASQDRQNDGDRNVSLGEMDGARLLSERGVRLIVLRSALIAVLRRITLLRGLLIILRSAVESRLLSIIGLLRGLLRWLLRICRLTRVSDRRAARGAELSAIRTGGTAFWTKSHGKHSFQNNVIYYHNHITLFYNFCQVLLYKIRIFCKN